MRGGSARRQLVPQRQAGGGPAWVLTLTGPPTRPHPHPTTTAQVHQEGAGTGEGREDGAGAEVRGALCVLCMLRCAADGLHGALRSRASAPPRAPPPQAPAQRLALNTPAPCARHTPSPPHPSPWYPGSGSGWSRSRSTCPRPRHAWCAGARLLGGWGWGTAAIHCKWWLPLPAAWAPSSVPLLPALLSDPSVQSTSQSPTRSPPCAAPTYTHTPAIPSQTKIKIKAIPPTPAAGGGGA